MKHKTARIEFIKKTKNDFRLLLHKKGFRLGPTDWKKVYFIIAQANQFPNSAYIQDSVQSV